MWNVLIWDYVWNELYRWEVEGIQDILLLSSLWLTLSVWRRPGQRTADDLEIIYDELLHIKALSHLSNTVSQLLHFLFLFN